MLVVVISPRRRAFRQCRHAGACARSCGLPHGRAGMRGLEASDDREEDIAGTIKANVLPNKKDS